MRRMALRRARGQAMQIGDVMRHRDTGDVYAVVSIPPPSRWDQAVALRRERDGRDFLYAMDDVGRMFERADSGSGERSA